MHPARPARSSTVARLTHWLRGTPLLVAAALGLLIGDATGGHGAALPAMVLAAGAGGATLLLLGATDPAWRRVAVALLALAFGQVAADRVCRPDFPPSHVAGAATHVPLWLEGVVTDDLVGNGDRARLWLAAERLDDGRGWRVAHGQILLSLRHAWRTWRAGERVRAAASLRRPRNFGNPGEFDYQGYLARRGVYVTGYAETDADFHRVGRIDSGLRGRLTQWRRGVGVLFRQTLPEQQAAVLSALIIGTDATLPRALRTAFSRAGVSHVLSISGLHVGLVAAAGYAFFRWLLARSRWLLLTVNVPKLAVALSVIPVLLYAGIAGSNVATIRSVIMIVVFLGAVLVDRQRHVIVSLAVAAIAVVLYEPGATLDISFELSFVAVLGLVLAMERFWPWWRQWEEARLLRLRGWTARVWRPLAAYVVVSFSALAATTPLTAFHFNQISLAAVVANAVVVPLLGSVAVALGLLAALAYTVAEPLARLCTLAAGPFVWLGLRLVEVFAALPYAALRVVTPTVFELALLYASLYAAVRMSGRRRALALMLLALVALGDGAWWYADRYHRADMRVTFLSVGNGDCAVIELPGAAVMMIDGGGLGDGGFDSGERIVAPFLWSRKIAHVDYLVLSHPQWDHYGGLAFVAEHFSPREFWSTGTASDSERFTELERALDANGIRRVTLRRGARRRIGAVEATVQSPPAQLDGLSVNNQSLVLSLSFGAARLLFPGDVEAPAEDYLVATTDGALASTVLKVPHHGSRTSSSEPFVDAVAPRLAVISAGFENRFGFPGPEVLQRYAAHHTAVARTDLDGAVQVRLESDGALEVTRRHDRSRVTKHRAGQGGDRR